MSANKNYLKQAYRLNELINSDLAELQSLKTLATSVSAIRYDQDRVQNGNNETSRIETLVLKIIDLEQIIDREIDQFINLKTDIRNAINAVENPNQKLLLRLRYVEFLSWSDIQERMGFCESQVYKVHGRALCAFRIPKKNFERKVEESRGKES